MKSQALQELVKKIFGDEKTRLQFMSDPDSVVSRFALTEQEKKAVFNTHARLGLVSGDSEELETSFAAKWDWSAPVP